MAIRVLFLIIVILFALTVSAIPGNSENGDKEYRIEYLDEIGEGNIEPYYKVDDPYPYYLVGARRLPYEFLLYKLNELHNETAEHHHHTPLEKTDAAVVYNTDDEAVGFIFTQVCPKGYFLEIWRFSDSKPYKAVSSDTIEASINYSKPGREVIDVTINGCNAIDIDGDKTEDYVTMVATGYDNAPRGVIALSGRDGSVLWKYSTAGIINQYQIHNIKEYGENLLFLATWPCSNGRTAGGFEDNTGNLHCIDLNGNRLWADSVTYPFVPASFHIGRVTGHEGTVIINNYTTGPASSSDIEYGLQVRNPSTGKVKKYRPTGKSLMGFKVFDMNRDMLEEIIVGRKNGRLSVQNADLADSISVNFETSIWLLDILDIENDYNYEIFLKSSGGLIVLDSDLNIKLSEEFDQNPWAIMTHPDVPDGKIIIMRDRDKNPFANYIYKIRPNPVTNRLVAFFETQRTGTMIIILVTGIILGITGTLKLNPASIRRRRQKRRDEFSSTLRNELLELLNAFGHGKLPIRNLDLITMYLSNPKTEGGKVEEYKRRLGNTIDVYIDHTRALLEEICGKLDIFETGRKNGRIMEMFKEFDNAIADIKDSNYRIETIADMQNASVTKLELIRDKIRSSRRSLMKYYSCDPVQIINEVIKSCFNEFANLNIQLGKIDITGNPVILAHIKAEDLSMLVEELLSNAIEAMRDSTGKTLSITIEKGQESIIIDIADTGAGIDEDNLSTIFKRGVSSKENGGYGLYFVVQTLEKYGGNIKVLNSEPGKGTTFRVALKSI
ncbi:MAG: GHKL domain-containing protein [candidate division Zixibacteria bacterium]|nr:GHKL domain-containing protein [candidate division Zixibacteria bacterium]